MILVVDAHFGFQAFEDVTVVAVVGSERLIAVEYEVDNTDGEEAEDVACSDP